MVRSVPLVRWVRQNGDGIFGHYITADWADQADIPFYSFTVDISTGFITLFDNLFQYFITLFKKKLKCLVDFVREVLGKIPFWKNILCSLYSEMQSKWIRLKGPFSPLGPLKWRFHIFPPSWKGRLKAIYVGWSVY